MSEKGIDRSAELSEGEPLDWAVRSVFSVYEMAKITEDIIEVVLRIFEDQDLDPMFDRDHNKKEIAISIDITGSLHEAAIMGYTRTRAILNYVGLRELTFLKVGLLPLDDEDDPGPFANTEDLSDAELTNRFNEWIGFTKMMEEPTPQEIDMTQTVISAILE